MGLPSPVEISLDPGLCHCVVRGLPVPLDLALWRTFWAVTVGLDRQSPPNIMDTSGLPGPGKAQPRSEPSAPGMRCRSTVIRPKLRRAHGPSTPFSGLRDSRRMRGEEASAALLERVRMTGDPVAADAAQVRAGNARFTVLTARLLRMEWSSDGVFEDRGTYAFPQRRAEPPPFEVREEDGATVVDTGSLVLRHAPDGRPFHAGNLSVERAEPPAFRWVPGAVDRHNLGGARRTVDRVRGGAALDPGLVSRSGWALFDDSVRRRLRARGRLGRAAARAPGLPGLVPLRPRPRLRRRGRRLHALRRGDPARPALRPRRLVVALLAVQRRRDPRRWSPTSARTACRSTCS